jgi:hypothetical protein
MLDHLVRCEDEARQDRIPTEPDLKIDLAIDPRSDEHPIKIDDHGVLLYTNQWEIGTLFLDRLLDRLNEKGFDGFERFYVRLLDWALQCGAVRKK